MNAHLMTSIAEQCQQKAAQDGLIRVISDNRWRELCWGLARTQYAAAWRSKDLLTGEVSAWDRQWYNNVGASYGSVLWLELQSPPDDHAALRRLLETVGVPFEEDGSFWVLGYQPASPSAAR